MHTQYISIITCMHNPSDVLLRRLFDAVEKCISNYGHENEYCLVDNNSSPPLHERRLVADFLRRNCAWVKLVCEPRPGLSFARSAGVNASSCGIVVFFDDDNEPDPNYLVQADALMREHPEVGCWGPGRVQVEFLGCPVHPWVASQRELFQERDVREDTISRDPSDFDHMPYGTGLVVRRDIMLDYLEQVNQGQYGMTGRLGRRLTSGEDLQIVYHGLKMGYAFGVSPSLRIKHLIAPEKATPKYVLRLAHGMWSSWQKSYNDVFPETPTPFASYTNLRILKELRWAFQSRTRGDPVWETLLRLTRVVAQVSGNYMAFPVTRPPLLLKLIQTVY